MRSKRIFHGWINVIACLLILAIGMGVLSNTASIYIKPVCDDLGFSRGAFSLHRTILSIVGLLCMPLFTRLLPKYGSKKILLVCSIGLALSVIGFSVSTQLWHFYVFGAMYGLFTNGISFFLIGTLINYWFIDKKGLATGIAYCGSNIGGAIAVSVIGNLMDTIGWRWAYAGSAILTITLLVPIILLMVKDRPEQHGMTPYQEKKATQADPSSVQFSGVLLSDAQKTPVFWVMLFAFFLFATGCGTPSHLTAFLSDNGYSVVMATTLTSVYQISVAVNKISIGALIDKLGISVGGFLLGLSCIGVPVTALLVHFQIAAWLHVILVGFICAGYSIAISIYVSKLFGNLDFSSILGVFSMDTTLGATVTTPFMGAIFDTTGSYRLSWIILLICAVLGAAGLAVISAMMRKRKA